MTGRALSRFIDAVVAGRRPRRFRAGPEDVEVLRVAVDLRAARPGDGQPTAAFTEGLFQRLSEQAERRPEPTPTRTARPRARVALVGAAAAVVLVGGTLAVTDSVTGLASKPGTVQVPSGSALRTGTFLTADGLVSGQIVAYNGHPSWVFMNVVVPDDVSSVTCMLQVEDGSTVAFGTFNVRGGTGQFSKTIGSVDVGDLRGARLVASSGTPIAEATFAR